MPDACNPRAEAGSNEADDNSTRKAERGGRNGEAVF